MGFYGKVNRADRVSFTIDRVYSTRKEMEDALKENKDMVAIGRYVLIDYDGVGERYPRLYTKNFVDFYFTKEMTASSRAKFLSEDKYIEIYQGKDFTYFDDGYIRKNDLIFILDVYLSQIFYICTGESNGYALFESVEKNPADASSYYNNFTTDFNYYGSSRGYDATVWQKIYADNKERYVMIAELNSVVPTFDLTIDAPTPQPVAPHFDKDSTNVYYRLHVQPNWGFRIKNANSDILYSDGKEYPSDGEKIDYIIQVYDPVERKYEDKNEPYQGAIYFNDAGFNPKIKTTSPETHKENKITILPTGKSDNAYNTHNPENPFEKVVTEDTQELVMMLPGLGDAVSKLWDIIYNDPGEGEERNDNMDWGSYAGVRMLTTTDDGYYYNEKNPNNNTLAGVINSAHDLMGMIIDSQYKDLKAEPPLDNVDSNKIYYYKNKFYIKEKGYDWVPASEGASPYQKINLANAYLQNNFYLKNLNKDYELSTALEAIEGVTYYYLDNITNVILDPEYQSNKYYYLDGENYLKDKKNSIYDKDKIYYKTLTTSTVASGTKYFFIAQKHTDLGDGQFKGLCYRAPIAGTTVEIPCNDSTDIKFSEIKTNAPFIGTYTIDYEWSDSEQKVVTTYNYSNKVDIDLIEFNTDEEYFIKEGDDYIRIKTLPENYYNSTKKYYTINEKVAIENFYERNKYYYLTPEDQNNYRWSNSDYNKNYSYYTLEAKGPYQYFYEPNKYYYFDKDKNKYILDNNLTMNENYEYYRYSDLFVDENNTNPYFIPGELWNTQLNKNDFNGLSLSYRYDSWRWKELKGFGRSINTLHGLILEINKILKSNDTLTRDNTTVQGCINKINDIIEKIEQLTPGYFLGVNQYGRITSMEPIGDNWINVTVDKEIEEVLIEHIGPVEKDARNESDKTPKFGETFEIEDWVFDEKGHQTNISTHTVKIPQGSLIAAAPNGSDVVTQLEFTPATGEIKTVRENLANLELADYIKGNDNGDVINTDTLGGALSKLQTQIIEEENTRAKDIADTMDSLNKAIEKEVADRNAAIKVETDARIEAINKEVTDRNAAIKVETDARIAAINALDATITTENAEVITSITQTDGLVTAGKKKVGELTLTGWTLGENVTNNESIADTDTVFNAFAKTQRQINANKVALAVLNGNSSTPGSVAYQIAQIVAGANANFDTLKEIADWIINDTAGVATINSNIADNKKAIEALELLVGDKAVATQIAEAINTALIVEGKNKYALASDLINLSDTVDNIIERVEKLENAVPAEKIAQWDAAVSKEEYETKIAELEQEDYTLNNRCNVLDQEVKNLINKASDFVTLKNYEVKIAELEQANYTLNSRCNVLDKEVKNLINIVAKFETRIAELEAKLQ